MRIKIENHPLLEPIGFVRQHALDVDSRLAPSERAHCATADTSCPPTP